tara:strand:+ start:92 stop:358 length:267 start_codon:yes stop_codon:yes gene_type:complete
MIGEERFITAIITQAVEDASYQGASKKYLKHKVNAIDWILNKESEHHWAFIDYCTMIGLSPSRIQDKVRTVLNPKLTIKQKSIMKGLQ